MFWLEARITAPGKHRRQLENLIAAMGGTVGVFEAGVSSEETTVTGYFPAEVHTGDTVRRLRERVGRVINGPPDIVFAEVHGEDPASGRRRLCTPFRVGKKLVIKPSWETYRPRPDEVVIDLDPTLVFGCGRHPTTSLALTFLEQYLEKGSRVIDVGTGSGILAVAAGKLGAGEVYAVDVDPAAIAAARETVVQNGLRGRVTIIEGNLLDSITDPCDLMLANIFTHLLDDFIPAAFSRLVPGGYLIVTGFTTDDEGLAAGLLRGAGFEIRKVAVRGGWVAMVARRP